ncbi:MAG: hypothetical protein R2695_20635 [Acidimicrobiales bacterium]
MAARSHAGGRLQRLRQRHLLLERGEIAVQPLDLLAEQLGFGDRRFHGLVGAGSKVVEATEGDVL